VTIDPTLHDMPPDGGKVQLDQTGAFRGPIAIDTTQLATGPQKLVVVSPADHPDRGSTQSGVMASRSPLTTCGRRSLTTSAHPS
jgi:hypothetical protein